MAFTREESFRSDQLNGFYSSFYTSLTSKNAFFNEASSHVTHVQWMVPGMSGPPGAFVHLHVVEVIVTVLGPARCLRMEESLAVAQRDRLSSATSLSAQVSQTASDHSSHSSMHTGIRSIHKNIRFCFCVSVLLAPLTLWPPDSYGNSMVY